MINILELKSNIPDNIVKIYQLNNHDPLHLVLRLVLKYKMSTVVNLWYI